MSTGNSDEEPNPECSAQAQPGYAVARLGAAHVMPFSARHPLLANQAAAGSGLLTIMMVSLISLACYSGACHVFASQISIWVMMAIFVAALLSGVVGFAFSAICGAMLFHLLHNPVDVVETMIVSSIAIQILSVVTLKNAIDLKCVSRFLVGGLVGLPIGIYLLMHMDASIYMKCIGVFLIGYGVYMLVRKTTMTTRYSLPVGDYCAGFLDGVTGGFATFPGAFVTIWCGLKGWPKDHNSAGSSSRSF